MNRDCGYERIKALSRTLRCPVSDLVINRGSDPFYAGTELEWKKAEWFKEVWERFDYSSGVHLRRIHYRIVGETGFQGPPKRTKEGVEYREPYENNEACWRELGVCASLARWLYLVPAEAFVDRRTGEALVPEWVEQSDESDLPYVSLADVGDWDTPRIERELYLREWDIPSPSVQGYDSSDWSDRTHYLELWIEKSTLDDVLVPLCEELGITLVTGKGFQSLTREVEMLLRAKRLGKPTRILYVSDFDPGGVRMPGSTARHIEYFRLHYAPELEIKLNPLALTAEQIKKHDLPREPSEKRGIEGFEEVHGKGVTEIDALEAKVPGELERLIREAVEPYTDDSISRRLREARHSAYEDVESAWNDIAGTYESELADLREQALPILDQYKERLRQLDEELQEQLAPHKTRLGEIKKELAESIEDFAPDLPDRPEPEVDPPDEDDWLFDSTRDYLTQLAAYKRRKLKL